MLFHDLTMINYSNFWVDDYNKMEYIYPTNHQRRNWLTKSQSPILDTDNVWNGFNLNRPPPTHTHTHPSTPTPTHPTHPTPSPTTTPHPGKIICSIPSGKYQNVVVRSVKPVYSISQEICTRFCCALLCCGYAIVHNEFTWSIYPYSSGLLCWHWGNR